MALIGEVDLGACGGAFALAVGFGPDPEEAGHRALGSLMDDPDGAPGRLRPRLARLAGDARSPKPAGGRGGRDLYADQHGRPAERTTPRASRARSIASLSTPWGEARGDEEKDTAAPGAITWSGPATSSSRPAACSPPGPGPRRCACSATCGRRRWPTATGPRTCGSAGPPTGTGIQLGETALPVLLARPAPPRRGADPGEARRGSGRWSGAPSRYIVRSGPSTQQDRWENQKGYTPFTARRRDRRPAGRRRLGRRARARPAVGDLPAGDRRRLERRRSRAGSTSPAPTWPAASGSRAITLRSIPPELDEGLDPASDGGDAQGADPPAKGDVPITEVVSPDALALVRFGLRAPDDPRIVDTVKVIDAVLKVETPARPVWHRYNGDGYGEHADGSPYDSTATAGSAAPGRS